MYAALDKTGLLINACDALERNEYFCCKCQKRVKLISTNNRKYFRHENKKDNDLNEREIHLLGKKIIKTEIGKLKPHTLETEVYLKKIKQRPDILVDQRIAFEYQCANLDVEVLKKRVIGYHKANMKNIWILGGHYLSNKLKREHLKFIDYNDNFKYYILMLDSQQKCFRLFHHINFLGPFNRLIYQKETFSSDKFEKMFRTEFSGRILKDLLLDDYFLERIRRQNDIVTKEIKLNFYLKHNCPLEEYLKGRFFKPEAPIYKTPAWQRQCGQKNIFLDQPLIKYRYQKIPHQ